MKVQTQFPEGEIPSDAHLVLLCLDYLMDLRRNNDVEVLNAKKQLDADYISVAIYALMRSIRRPDYLATKTPELLLDCVDLDEINDLVLSPSATFQRPYDMGYNDLHPSNLYRFYELEGLAGGPDNGPMLLTDLVEAGLGATKARCRLEAEKDIVKSTQFELYIQSVTNRGFFNDPANSGKRKDPKEEEERRARKSQVYKEKYRRAIAKYREKLAVNITYDSADISMLSPPNSPPTKPMRSARAFSSPPRTCQTGMKEGPLSPLTPNTIERTFSPTTTPKTPKTPKAGTRELAEDPAPAPKTPKKTSPREAPSDGKRSSAPTRSASTSSLLKTPVRSSSTSAVRNPVTPSTPLTSTPVRSNSSTPPRSIQDSPSTIRKIEESPQSTLGRMARRRGTSKAPKESPLDTKRRSRSRSTSVTRKKRLESDKVKTPSPAVGKQQPPTQAKTHHSRKSSPPSNKSPSPPSHKSSPPPSKRSSSASSQKAPDSPSKSIDPSGYSPVYSPERDPPKPPDVSPRRSLSPEMQVKVQAFSLYEWKLNASASSGLEVNAGSFHSVASPKTRRRKSEYEKKLEEQKKLSGGWACPAGLALPDITDSPVPEETEKPARKGRPKSINTTRVQEATKKGPKTPKANASARHIKVETLRTSDPPAGTNHHGVGSHPRSPVARVRREKNKEELHKLRHGLSSPVHKSEEALSPRRFPGVKEVGSRDDTSWIAGQKYKSKAEPDKEESKKPRERSLSFRKKRASGLHVNSTTKASFGSSAGRMPANSPKAGELKIDPFRITPPQFLGKSRLFAAVAADPASEQPGGVGLSSPRALASPRGLRSSPRNFNSTPIKRAC